MLGCEGIGRPAKLDEKAGIYAYAQQLWRENLGRWLERGGRVQLTIIIPG